MTLGQRAFLAMCALLAVVAACAVVALWPSKADAEESCGPWKKMVGTLERQYSEQLVGAGVSNGNAYVLQLFTEKQGKTWTILRTDTRGWSCIIAAGESWNEHDPWAVRPQSISHHHVEPHNWIAPRKNDRGISCCGPYDIVEIPNHEAAQADIGSKITADFPAYGNVTVTVSKVFPSEDAHSYITRFGCLFKQFGM